jgi:outer membrane biosynthesis protein TonB
VADPKNVIYLEVDEDITSAVDKLTKNPASKVQIVTAKRSSIMQSVINQRLLKKAASDAGKEVVLVTTDRVATNLAGRVGLPVASQVGEAAVVPKTTGPGAATTDDEIDGGTVGDEMPTPTAKLEPAPEPEPEPAPKPTPPVAPAAAATAALAEASKPSPKPSKDKQIPNASKMQKRVLWIGVGVVALIALLGLNYFITSAKVTLFAQADRKNASFTFTADPNVTQSSTDTAVLAASQLKNSKTLSAPVQATGTKDLGTKAHGQMVVSNCYDSSPHTLVAGTRFVSPNGKVFRSDSDVTVPGGQGSFFGCSQPGTANVNVTADQNGDDYNLGSGTKYTIPALPESQQQGIYGTGGQMQGGTTKTAKVITQDDVNKAQKQALDSDHDGALNDLKGKAGSSQVALEASFASSVTATDSNPNVGDQADSGTVSVHVDYTMLAVSKSDLSAVTKAQEEKIIGPTQQIYDDGSGNLDLTAKPGTGQAVNFDAKAVAYAGEKIDQVALAKQLKGKKYGDAVDLASHVSGVDRADIKLSPVWATGMPGIQSHIHIDIKASQAGQ